jgi:hypothetical protein
MHLSNADRARADLYKAFASSLFGVPVEQVDTAQRQMAKAAQLGLGFGAGPATFQRIARVMGNIELPLHPEGEGLCAEGIVRAWRQSYSRIAAGWRSAGSALQACAEGREIAIDPWGLCVTAKDAIILPSGRAIHYPNLRQIPDGLWPDGRHKLTWAYASGRHQSKIHGAKVVENMVQALARDTLFGNCLEFFQRTGLRPALRVHDELVYVVHESRAEEMLDTLQSIMRTPPPWWPELAVWSEGDIAQTYGEAK